MTVSTFTVSGHSIPLNENWGKQIILGKIGSILAINYKSFIKIFCNKTCSFNIF
jgi:hypothetical protein